MTAASTRRAGGQTWDGGRARTGSLAPVGERGQAAAQLGEAAERVGEPAGQIGDQLRAWRERRRLSQLDLALRVEVSTRHLSCIETGKARPSPTMILRLTEHLDVPLRERNDLLLAGGYAPAYPEHAVDAPALARVADALRLILDGHLPYPAVVLNRWWEMVDANAAVPLLTAGVASRLLEPPVNVLRLTLAPDGLAPRLLNLPQWRAHLLGQLRRRWQATGDARLGELYGELATDVRDDPAEPAPAHQVVVPMRLQTPAGELSLFSVAAHVDTATDVTVDELAIETFYPADAATADLLRSHAGASDR